MKLQDSPYIFLDTCSLLASCWNGDDRRGEAIEFSAEKEQRFWEEVLPGLFNTGEVILPLRNFEELQKHAKSNKKQWLSDNSRYVLDKLSPLIQSGKIQVVGDPNDPFADAILLSVALKFRTQRNMAFITQDRKLAEDLWAIQNFQSVQPRNGVAIKIRRIAPDGSLAKHRDLHDEGGSGSNEKSTRGRFGKGGSPKSVDDTPPASSRHATTKPWWEA